MPDFRIAVGISAACDADTKVGVFAQQMAEAQFRVEISRGHGKAQREIGHEKMRLVAKIKSVAGKRRMALERSVIGDLDEFAGERIDLGKRRKRACAAHQYHE